ncbi:MAG: hypothetical protein KKC20_10230 [Proteobacteria bacterium]|nr:hypothetical protein [Pseudomonadota bacterium]
MVKRKFDQIFQYATSFIAMFAMVFAIAFQYVSFKEKKYERLKSNVELVELKNQVEVLKKDLSEIITSSIVVKNTNNTSNADLSAFANNVEKKISKLEEQVTGLRQAIDPLKPEEVLTIARLKDSINTISEKIKNQEKVFEEKQKNFTSSVIRELDASSKATSWLFVVLIPVVLNLLYSIWRDKNKKISEPNSNTEG